MRRLQFRHLAWLLLLSVSAACDEDGEIVQEDAVASNGQSVEVSIDPAVGGTVQLAGGPKLSIPAGALPGIGAVSIVVSEVTLPQMLQGLASEVWEFRPVGTRFDKPVQIELPFAARGGAADEYTIAWTKADDRAQFEDLPTTFAGDDARGEIRHFSLGCIRKRDSVRVVCDPDSSVPLDSNSDGLVDGCECRAGRASQDAGCVPAARAGAAASGGRAGSAGLDEVETSNSQIPAANGGSGGSITSPESSPRAGSGTGGRGAPVTPMTQQGGAGAGSVSPQLPSDGDSDAGVEPPPPNTGSSTQITSFMLEVAPGTRFTGVIDQAASAITVTVPAGTDVSALRVLIGSNGKSVSPTGTLSFVAPVVFTVTGRSGGARRYTVTVVTG